MYFNLLFHVPARVERSYFQGFRNSGDVDSLQTLCADSSDQQTGGQPVDQLGTYFFISAKGFDVRYHARSVPST